MKRLLILCLIPLLAGCFAWDLDEKPLPWYPDPQPEKPSIGTVVHYPSGKQPYPEPQPATYITQPAYRPVTPAPRLEPAPKTVYLKPAAPVAPAVEPKAPPVAGDGGAEKRLSALESRLEELYQLILKSYKKDQAKERR